MKKDLGLFLLALLIYITLIFLQISFLTNYATFIFTVLLWYYLLTNEELYVQRVLFVLILLFLVLCRQLVFPIEVSLLRIFIICGFTPLLYNYLKFKKVGLSRESWLYLVRISGVLSIVFGGYYLYTRSSGGVSMISSGNHVQFVAFPLLLVVTVVVGMVYFVLRKMDIENKSIFIYLISLIGLSLVFI